MRNRNINSWLDERNRIHKHSVQSKWKADEQGHIIAGRKGIPVTYCEECSGFVLKETEQRAVIDAHNNLPMLIEGWEMVLKVLEENALSDSCQSNDSDGMCSDCLLREKIYDSLERVIRKSS